MSEKVSPPGIRPREFQPVNDPVEAKKLVKEGFRTLASVMIWSKEQKHVINTQLSVIHEQDKILYTAIPAETRPDEFMDQLEAIGSHDCYFSVSLTRANIFFKAKCVGYDEGGFRFELPTAVYKVQRRKDMRLFIPFGRVIRVEIQDPNFPDEKLSKKIFDISAGGISFVVNDTEALLFHPGAHLKGISFSIGSRKITVDCEVRHVRAQAPDSAHPGHKVGVRFERVSAGDQEWISAYIFEESRKLVVSFL